MSCRVSIYIYCSVVYKCIYVYIYTYIHAAFMLNTIIRCQVRYLPLPIDSRRSSVGLDSLASSLESSRSWTCLMRYGMLCGLTMLRCIGLRVGRQTRPQIQRARMIKRCEITLLNVARARAFAWQRTIDQPR